MHNTLHEQEMAFLRTLERFRPLNSLSRREPAEEKGVSVRTTV